MMGRLLILTIVVYSCTAAPTTDRVVPEYLDFTAFSKLAPTDLLQAVIQSGGTEADCRTFATTTISTISESVKSQGENLNAVDTGAGCAAEGQELVQVAQGKLQGKQGVLATKEGLAKAAREAKTAACTAAVDMSVGLDTLTRASCYDYTTEASFISTIAACTGATTASNQAAAAVVSAQTGVDDAQGEVNDAVAEAARLKSGCLCRVHQEQAAAQVAVQAATATNAADWKQAHEVLCAVKQTTTCPVPSCPTVTQPTLADGVANADTQHCTQAPTDAPTPPPTDAPTPPPTDKCANDTTCVDGQCTSWGICSTMFKMKGTSAKDGGAECKAHCNNEDGYAYTVHGQPNCRCCSAPAKRLSAGGWNYWMGTC
jgi:hypothetical protein